FQAEDGIRDRTVTGVQTCALPIYDGWIEITYVGSEVTDPERNMPRSIVLSTVIGIALYCLVTAAFAYVLSPSKMAASSLVASDRSEEHTSEPSHRTISYAVFCLKK